MIDLSSTERGDVGPTAGTGLLRRLRAPATPPEGEGPTLQDAADDLVRRVLTIARALRTGGFSVPREVAHDVAALNFLYELDEIAAAGEDVRTRLFGT